MGMVCGSCGQANRDDARFCGECGERLIARCATCDAELEPEVKFCNSCGAPTSDVAPARAEQSRKTVTVVFADLAGSTGMHEAMDPESVRSFNARYYTSMRAVVERHRGRIVKYIGDGVMAVFGVPEVAEDDARRALAAALEMATVTDRVRVGVNTGEVVVDERDDDVVGDAVNVAARLEGAARVGGVLVGPQTYRLTRDHAIFGEPQPLQVKGRLEAVDARELRALGTEPDERSTGFVGRNAELARLVGAIGTVDATGRSQLLSVLGSPGVGKSRLIAELDASVRDIATVLVGRCDSAGGPTFAPVADIVARALAVAEGVDDDVAAAIGFLMGDGDPGTPERTFWGLRRVLEAASRVRPVVVILDDAHWAEPMLLDLMEHLAEWLGDHRVLLVVAGRPELRELRPALVEAGGRASAVLSLEGLDPDATRRLATELLGSGGLPHSVATRVVDATDGNPLFVRELIRMLVDDGVLRVEEGGWVLTVDEAEIEVPPTITALLAARIERLRADERTILERASVLGQEVVRGALAHLVPAQTRAQLDVVLESLRRRELLETADTYWIDEPVLRFHHALIRDAAYRRVLRAARAELHERAAEWFVHKTGGGPDHGELIGFHLEQAQANLRELGALDAHGRAVAFDAARRLGDAAYRALHRDDLPAAGALAGRALACLDPNERARAELLLVRCEASLGTGDVAGARSGVDELATLADGDERLAAWATAFTVQLATFTGTADLIEAEAVASSAAERLGALGDHTGASKAHRTRASVLARLGRVADTEAALDRALTEAREAGDQRQISGVLAAAPLAALWGPSPVPRAGGRCLDVVRLLRITTGAREVEAISTRCQAVLEAFRGRHEAARKMLATSRRTLEDLGLRNGLLELELYAGLVELAAGDAFAADEHLGLAHNGFAALGMDVDAAQAASLQGRAALQLGDLDRALVLAETAQRLGGRDLKTSITWRGVKAEVIAQRGEHDEAVDLARAAVALAEPTDALVDKADAFAALATVLTVAGDTAGAREASERARALYDEKGASALASRQHTDGPGMAPSVLPQPTAAGENAAVRTVRLSNERLLAGDWDGYRRVFAPDVVYEDHRSGLTDRRVGVEELEAIVRPALELGVTRFAFEVLELRGDDLALLQFRTGGDGFEIELVMLVQVDADERECLSAMWDLDALDEATAELERRALERQPRIVRLVRASDDFVTDGRWDEFRDSMHPAYTYEDRRYRQTFDRAHTVDSTRHAFDEDRGSVLNEILEVRGEDLALVRDTFTASGGFEVTSLFVMQSGADGLMHRMIQFGQDDLEAATAELERMAAPRLENAAVRRIILSDSHLLAGNTEAYADGFHPDVVHEDRRTALANRRVGVAALVTSAQVTNDVAIDSMARDVVALRGDDLALVTTRVSMADFDVEFLLMVQLGPNGRMRQAVVLDPDALDEAITELDDRYEQTLPEAERAVIDLQRRGGAAFASGDTAAAEGLVTPTFTLIDHRAVGLGVIDRAALSSTFDAVTDRGSGYIRYATEILRLTARGCVARNREVEADSLGGSIETETVVVALVADGLFEHLEIFPADEADRAVACFDELVATQRIARRGDRFELHRSNGSYVVLDGGAVVATLENLQAAIDDLYSRYVATLDPVVQANLELQRRFLRAYESGDLETVAELLSPSFQQVDHQLAGYQPMERAALVDANKELSRGPGLFSFAEEHLILDAHGNVTCMVEQETNDSGGEVEWRTLVLTTIVDGAIDRLEYFPIDQLDAALDRYRELTVGELIARRDDHLVLRRSHSALLLFENDRVVASFAVDMLREALIDLHDRHVARLPTEIRAALDLGRRNVESYNANDGSAFLETLHPDFEFVDHHALSYGQMSIDQTVTAVETNVVDAPRRLMYAEELLAYSEHGLVSRVREVVLNDTGGSVEQVAVAVLAVRDGLVWRVEQFPIVDVGPALARFAELSRLREGTDRGDRAIADDDLASPQLSNRATAAADAFGAAFARRDWETLASLFDEAHEFIDNRVVVGGSRFDREATIDGVRSIVDLGFTEIQSRYLAIRGEHLVLLEQHYVGDGNEVVVLEVIEIGDDGRFVHDSIYDADDFASAYEELSTRFESTLPRSLRTTLALTRAVGAAWSTGDSAAFERWLAPGFRFVDHWLIGMGEVTKADLTATVASVLGGGPAYHLYTAKLLAFGERGGVFFMQEDDRNDTGGETQQQQITVVVVDGDLVERIENFPPGEAAAAVARFKELTSRSIVSTRGDRFVLRRAGDLLELTVDDTVVATHDDLLVAVRELEDRFLDTLSPVVRDNVAVQRRFVDAYIANDVETVARRLSARFVQVDHQPAGYGTLDRAEFLATCGEEFGRADGLLVYVDAAYAINERGNVTRTVEIERNDLGGVVEWHTIVVTTIVDGLIDRMEVFEPGDVDAALERFRELSAP